MSCCRERNNKKNCVCDSIRQSESYNVGVYRKVVYRINDYATNVPENGEGLLYTRLDHYIYGDSLKRDEIKLRFVIKTYIPEMGARIQKVELDSVDMFYFSDFLDSCLCYSNKTGDWDLVEYRLNSRDGVLSYNGKYIQYTPQNGFDRGVRFDKDIQQVRQDYVKAKNIIMGL